MLKPHAPFIVSDGLERQRADLRRVEPCGVRAREILLECLHVLAGQRRLVMIRDDERRRLQAMDQRVRAIEPPVGVGLVPHAVEPDAADRAVVRQQLGELRDP